MGVIKKGIGAILGLFILFALLGAILGPHDTSIHAATVSHSEDTKTAYTRDNINFISKERVDENIKAGVARPGDYKEVQVPLNTTVVGGSVFDESDSKQEEKTTPTQPSTPKQTSVTSTPEEQSVYVQKQSGSPSADSISGQKEQTATAQQVVPSQQTQSSEAKSTTTAPIKESNVASAPYSSQETVTQYGAKEYAASAVATDNTVQTQKSGLSSDEEWAARGSGKMGRPAYQPQSTTPAYYSPASSPSSSGGVFVGSINSDKYHYPSCGSAKNIHPENEIWFSSSEDARNHGYIPCKRCHPP